MTARALFLTGLVAFIMFTVIRLPASILVPGVLPSTVNYRVIEGTLWQGEIKQLSSHGRALGNASYTLDALSLLSGDLEARINLSGGDVQGQFVWQQAEADQISKLDMVLDIRARFGSQTAVGAIRLANGEFTVVPDGTCATGAADVRTNMLQQGLGLEGPMLAGKLLCRDGAMQIVLIGDLQGLEVTIDGDLGEPISISLTPAAGADIPEGIRQALALSGFSPSTDGSLKAQLELDIFL